MTNEQLAELIKDGHAEYTEQLWGRLEKFIALKARQYYELHKETCDKSGITRNDLAQEGFFAFSKALEAYEVGGEYKFITMLNYPLLSRFGYILDYRDKHRLKELLNNCGSLDVVIGDEKTSALKEFIPDERAAEEIESVNADVDNKLLHEDLEKRIDALPHRQGETIRQMYFYNVPVKELAKRFNVSYNMIATEHRAALKRLRHNPELKKYRDDIIATHTYGGTLSRFLHTGTSSVEHTVLKLFDIENGRNYRNDSSDSEGALIQGVPVGEDRYFPC